MWLLYFLGITTSFVPNGEKMYQPSIVSKNATDLAGSSKFDRDIQNWKKMKTEVNLTMLVQAEANIMYLGLNPIHWIGPGWFPSSTVSFWPLSEPHTWTRPSCEPVN